MKTNLCPDPAELIQSPMKPVAITMPAVLVAALDKAAAIDDSSAPNRSSLVRRAICQFLRRQEVA
ncbi:hypothetical protein [Bradyrhizobium sp.]|uniref:hypothetical protein n=1 Tax=Bradyrhizobium sp. TaxID=376 RepID=UPI0007C8E48C|nr:hypothetical protein [Bradyrhizobium sp.]